MPAAKQKTSARPIVRISGYVHTCGFRLECFAVYASSLSLPRERQNSLHNGSDSSFYDRTFTCKMRSALLGALVFLIISEIINHGIIVT